MAFDANSVNFSAFSPVQAEYGPRDIKAEAIYVTVENIGKLALEFEKDVLYPNGSTPMFYFVAEREGDAPIRLTVQPDVWIIKLWGELHIFRADLFRNTFEVKEDEPTSVITTARGYPVRPWANEEAAKKIRDHIASGMEKAADVEGTQIMKPVGQVEFVEDAWGVRGNPIPSPGIETGFEITRGEHPLSGTEPEPVRGELDTDESNGTV